MRICNCDKKEICVCFRNASSAYFLNIHACFWLLHDQLVSWWEYICSRLIFPSGPLVINSPSWIICQRKTLMKNSRQSFSRLSLCLISFEHLIVTNYIFLVLTYSTPCWVLGGILLFLVLKKTFIAFCNDKFGPRSGNALNFVYNPTCWSRPARLHSFKGMEWGADGERGEHSKMCFKGVLEFHLEGILFLINVDP